MNKTDIKAAAAALTSGNYKLTATSKGRGAALALFLHPKAPGADLARFGWNEERFASCLGAYLASLPADADVYANVLRTLGGTNSSAASKAAADLTFEADGLSEKPTLGDVWTACLGGGRAAPSVSLPGLADLA